MKKFLPPFIAITFILCFIFHTPNNSKEDNQLVVLAGGGADNGDEQNPAPKTENGTKLSLTDIKDIVLIISSLVTIFIAFTSLQKWQLELKGKVLYDYARVFS